MSCDAVLRSRALDTTLLGRALLRVAVRRWERVYISRACWGVMGAGVLGSIQTDLGIVK